MRRSVLIALGVLVITLGAWLVLSTSVQQGSGDRASPIPVTQQPQAPQSTAAHRGAAAAIRSAQVGQTPPAQRADAPKAPSASPASPKGDAASQPADNSKAPPKSPAELIAPFIEDNSREVFLPDSVRNHAAVQAEPQDPDWGPGASQAMSGYLAEQLGERAEYIYADCRTDLCELQLVSGPGGDASRDQRDFQQVVSMMQREGWWGAYDFDQSSGIVTFSDDGRIILIWFFSRK